MKLQTLFDIVVALSIIITAGLYAYQGNIEVGEQFILTVLALIYIKIPRKS